MKAVYQTIIYGAIFISFCAVALCMETNLLLGIPFNSFYFYLTVFSATLGQYNIHYYIKKSVHEPSDRFKWSDQHRNIHLILNIAGAIGLLIGLSGLKIHHFMALIIIAGIAILYSFPVLPLRRKRLKDFGILKILSLTLVWTLITVWFPVIKLSGWNLDMGLVFVHRFLFVFILCLSFDIRDLKDDREYHIQTIPLRIGKEKTYRLIYLLLFLFVVLSFSLFSIHLRFMEFNVMIFSALATYLVIERTKKEGSDFYYLFAVDGMMLLQPVLLLLVSLDL